MTAGNGSTLQPGSSQLLPGCSGPGPPRRHAQSTALGTGAGPLRTPARPTWAKPSASSAAVEHGFEFSNFPDSHIDGMDYFRNFYPRQGFDCSDTPLVYGATVRSFLRSVNAKDYANYQRTVGQAADSTQGAPQLYAEAWNADANNITPADRLPVGLWQDGFNASDTKEQTTLDEKVKGDLVASGILVPSGFADLACAVLRPDHPAMGDTVPLMIQLGLVDVDTTVRIVGSTT